MNCPICNNDLIEYLFKDGQQSICSSAIFCDYLSGVETVSDERFEQWSISNKYLANNDLDSNVGYILINNRKWMKLRVVIPYDMSADRVERLLLLL